MEAPSKYSDYNRIQRRDAQFILNEYEERMQWRKDGTDTVLDVGCGTGDLTIDIILTQMPKKFGKLVGVDISQEIIEYAKRTHQRENIYFEVLDIESDDDDIQRFSKKHPDRFDHVMSFYCLHWVRNQAKAVKNIYNLLKLNGHCLLVLLVKNPIYNIYTELSKTKWKYLMSDMDGLLTDFHSRGNAAAAMVEMLTVAGFKDHEVRIIPGKMEFTGYNEIKANVTVINPVWLKMNAEEQNEYLRDYLDIAAGMGIYKEADDQNESTFSFSYQLLNVHAAK